ncbi:hypothetical protein HZF10_04165 [Flavobacterium sp. MAH-1]|uniref:Uncharacterized protein n=1 Tax=Flavobacterium agri TaxID=2743471 RepID=A0A7Y8Y075_9FLAO|nr:hypothetical protein [Flavobacterium agri]
MKFDEVAKQIAAHPSMKVLSQQEGSLYVHLWDNLFYQIITSKSPYVRDGILSVLTADFFLKTFDQVERTDKSMQKLAQARIVMPKGLFDLALVSGDQKGVKKTSHEAKAILESDSKNIILSSQIDENIALSKSIERVQALYDKSEAGRYKKTYDAYNGQVQQAYAQAEKVERVVTDPVTGATSVVVEYVGLVLPTFSYTPNSQIEFLETSGILSESQILELSEVSDENGFESLDDIQNYLKQQVDTATQQLFARTPLQQRLATTGGVVLPTGSQSRIGAANGSQNFTITGSSRNGLHSLALLFDNVAPTVINAPANTYSVIFNGQTTPVIGTSFNQNRLDGKLQVTIFLEKLNVAGKASFTLEGDLMLSDNSLLHFQGSAIVKIKDIMFLNFCTSNGSGTYTRELLLDEGQHPEEGDENVPAADYIPSGFGIKRLGIADYRKVEQEVCCYVPGEVSHIENVMAREYKEKATRRMRRTENTTTSSTEKETEKLTDTTSTDRFEMNQEVASVIAEDTSIGAHASFSAEWDTGTKYGLQAGADFANNTSSEVSDSQAITHAKELTERALERVVTKVKEERVSKIIEEFEENNKHGFDNRKGDKHVSGVFRWVDKVYRNRILNYGKRLMYEFMIPEPAFFHNKAVENSDKDGDLIKPIDPREGSGTLKLELGDNFESRYKYWAQAYNAEVAAPPKEKSFSKEFGTVNDRDGVHTMHKNGYSFKVDIEDGYECTKFSATGGFVMEGSGSDAHTFMVVNVGTFTQKYDFNNTYKGARVEVSNYPLTKYIGTALPVSIMVSDAEPVTLNVTAFCAPTAQTKEQWQMEAFNAIIDAYQTKLDQYNAKYAELMALRDQKIRLNPMFYRQIENTVLRKNCIEYMVSHDALGKTPFVTGTLLKDIRATYDDAKLETYAATVKFFEQAFEWDLMSYHFYPFYWSQKDKWQEKYLEQNDDPLFRSFLQSGMARVIVTVRPGFEEVVNWYMATGQIWNGGQVPTIDDPLFLSIIEEIRQPEGAVEGEWETRVPTSLTVIQAGTIGLNVEGLPCDDDCKDYRQFDSDGHPVLDSNGDPISTNPISQSDNVSLGNVVEDQEAIQESITAIQEDIEEIKDALNIAE